MQTVGENPTLICITYVSRGTMSSWQVPNWDGSDVFHPADGRINESASRWNPCPRRSYHVSVQHLLERCARPVTGRSQVQFLPLTSGVIPMISDQKISILRGEAVARCRERLDRAASLAKTSDACRAEMGTAGRLKSKWL